MDMHPKADQNGGQSVALYIDTKYEVTKSIRIVLQYDVEVIMGWVSNLAMNEKDDDATVDDEDGDELFDYMEDISSQCTHYLDSTRPTHCGQRKRHEGYRHHSKSIG